MKYLAQASLLLVPFFIAMLLFFGEGCTSSQKTSAATGATVASTQSTNIKTDLDAFQVKLDALGHTAITDLSSPDGQALVGAVTSTAFNVGADVATGNDAGAVISGLEGAATALNDYSGLPSVSSTTLGKAAADGSGVLTVADKVAPTLVTIIQAAKQKSGGTGTYAIVQAIVRGLFAVRPAVTAATTIGRAAGIANIAWVALPARRWER